MLMGITTGSIQNLGYSFNPETGNLISRKDNLLSLQEMFTYDNLGRLTGVSGPAPLTTSYSANGNILSKTVAGDYTYGTKPNAVSTVTNPNAYIPTTEQLIACTSFNKADSIIEGNNQYILLYGHENQRTISRLYSNGILQKTVYYAGEYEKEVTPGKQVRELNYIMGGDGLAAIFVNNNGSSTTYFIHSDHLGSYDRITNQSGQVVQSYSFDAYGKRRNPADWTYNNVPTSFLFTRGYTGQEHLDQFGLINMNGRNYDPILGRFVSPDNCVQLSGLTQSYNRYTYCLNNPLIYTDPTGYTWWSHFRHWVSDRVGDAVSTTGKLAAWGITFIPSAIDAIHNGDWSRLDPFLEGTISNNCYQINRGLIQGSPLQVLSRFTWELPQTIVGYVASQGSNIIGDVKNVSYYDGATVVQHYSGSWGGFTLGSYINGDNSIEADPTNPLFQHEYGHYLQSQEAGWAFLGKYAIPSLINAMKTPNNWYGGKEHDAYGVEQDADIRARAYFGEKVWRYDENPIFDSGHNDWFDSEFGQYRTNKGLIHTSWWESALTMALCIGF